MYFSPFIIFPLVSKSPGSADAWRLMCLTVRSREWGFLGFLVLLICLWIYTLLFENRNKEKHISNKLGNCLQLLGKWKLLNSIINIVVFVFSDSTLGGTESLFLKFYSFLPDSLFSKTSSSLRTATLNSILLIHSSLSLGLTFHPRSIISNHGEDISQGVPAISKSIEFLNFISSPSITHRFSQVPRFKLSS